MAVILFLIHTKPPILCRGGHFSNRPCFGCHGNQSPQKTNFGADTIAGYPAARANLCAERRPGEGALPRAGV